eukprot:UN09774
MDNTMNSPPRLKALPPVALQPAPRLPPATTTGQNNGDGMMDTTNPNFADPNNHPYDSLNDDDEDDIFCLVDAC